VALLETEYKNQPKTKKCFTYTKHELPQLWDLLHEIKNRDLKPVTINWTKKFLPANWPFMPVFRPITSRTRRKHHASIHHRFPIRMINLRYELVNTGYSLGLSVNFMLLSYCVQYLLNSHCIQIYDSIKFLSTNILVQ
jgi:hypothetical protein